MPVASIHIQRMYATNQSWYEIKFILWVSNEIEKFVFLILVLVLLASVRCALSSRKFWIVMALRNVNDFVLGTISGQEQTTDFQLIAKVDDSVTFSTV